METVKNGVFLTDVEYERLNKAAEGEPVKKRLSTSKKVLWMDIIVAITLTAAVVFGEFTGHDMTNSAIVAGLWDAQLAAIIGAYQWKAKNENRSKHAMALVRELADKYGIEAAVQVAEVVLKE